MPILREVFHASDDKAKVIVVNARKAAKDARKASYNAACERTNELRLLAEVVIGKPMADRLANQGRFWALAWGSNVPGLVRLLKEASYTPKAYVEAFERVVGAPCRGVPGRIYRNARQLQG